MYCGTYLLCKNMAKDFIKWHVLKVKLQEKAHIPFFQQQEIWWCSIGVNLGYEEDGKNDFFERPVVIFKKFSKDYFWGIPLTSQKKKGKFYYQFMIHGRKNTALLWQLRLFSSKRLLRKMEKMPDSVYENIKKRIIEMHEK